MSDWQEQVYHPEKSDNKKHWNSILGKCTTYWQKIRNETLREDNHTCQRCGDRNVDNLTIHHVTPRALGGGDNAENLITLCNKCHDEVEILGYLSKWQIMNLFEEEDSADDAPETTDKWQGWVYGSKRRPR